MQSHDELRLHISRQLKNARMSSGITVTEAAEALDKSKNTVYAWELGRILPTADVFLQVMNLYGIENFDVFTLNDAVNKRMGLEHADTHAPVIIPNASTRLISSEEREMLELMQGADEQGKAAAKVVLTSFQRRDGGASIESVNNVVNFK